MKIKKATIKNVKKIKFAEINLADKGEDVIVITGPNKAGKTSFLDGLFSVFGGQNALQKMPINAESDKADINVILDNGLELTRKITSRGTTLAVKANGGAPIASPQKYVNEKLRLFSFDPAMFVDETEAKRIEYLKKIQNMVIGNDLSSVQEYLDRYNAAQVENETPIDAIDRLINPTNGIAYLKRRDISRDIKSLEAIVDYSDESAESLQDNISKIKNEIELVNNSKMSANHETTKKIKISYDNFIASYRKLIAELPDNPQSDEMINIVGISGTIQKGADYIDNALKAQASKIEDAAKKSATLNRELYTIEERLRSHNKNAKTIQKLSELRSEKNNIERDMDNLSRERMRVLSQSKMPIDGIEIKQDCIYINGIPFEQCSSSEKLLVSIRLAIALNPELRVMRILNGNMLDEDTFMNLKDIISESDYQLWIEWVDTEDSGVGYFFKNGEIVS